MREYQYYEFIAIDRFTGGGADGAKFSLKPAIDPVFAWKVRIQLYERVESKTRASALGLLALLFRDIAEGDLTVGYGANKGYGSVKLEGAVIEHVSWPAIQALLETNAQQPSELTNADEGFKSAVRHLVAAFRAFKPTGTTTDKVHA